MMGRHICFHSEIRKNIFELSSLPLLSEALREITETDHGNWYTFRESNSAILK